MAKHETTAGRMMARSLGLAVAFAMLALSAQSFADVIIYKKVDKASVHITCVACGSTTKNPPPPPPPPPPHPALTMPQNNLATPTHSAGVRVH